MIYSIHLKNSRFAEDVLFSPSELSNVLSQNLNKLRLSQWCSCLHLVWRGNLILTILSCENPSNIWESKYGPQMCGANKLTDKMSEAGWVNLIVWFSYFSALCFHAFYSIRSHARKWFVSQNMEPLSLRSTIRGVMMNMLAIRYFFSLSWKLKNQSLKLVVITFCKERPSCNRAIKRGSGNLTSQARW